jgi:hypothetical protein
LEQLTVEVFGENGQLRNIQKKQVEYKWEVSFTEKNLLDKYKQCAEDWGKLYSGREYS